MPGGPPIPGPPMPGGPPAAVGKARAGSVRMHASAAAAPSATASAVEQDMRVIVSESCTEPRIYYTGAGAPTRAGATNEEKLCDADSRRPPRC